MSSEQKGTDGRNELPTILLKQVTDMSLQMATILRERVRQTWTASPVALFELCLYNLFKVDLAACGRLSEDTRDELMDRCELGLALCFEPLKIAKDKQTLLDVIADRMDAYSHRSASSPDLPSHLGSLRQGLIQNLKRAAAWPDRVQVAPPVVLGGATEWFLITALVMDCEESCGGLAFYTILVRLFESGTDPFAFSPQEIRKYFASK